MRARRTQAAFSLFSFQDIITSVTAILILIMLLLTLELVTRRRQQAATDPAVTRGHLEAVTATLEALVARLREDVANARRSMIERRTLGQLEAELERRESERATARQQLTETERTLKTVAELRRHAEERLVGLHSDRDLIAALSLQQAVDREEAERLEEANRQANDDQTRRRQSGAELVFNIPTDANRRSWLVELSSDGAVVCLVGGDTRQELGLGTGDGSALSKWADRLDPTGDQCLLLLRPSATLPFLDALETRLAKRNIGYGLDLVGEDQTVRIGATVATGRRN
jgi:multidrug efflux pump subunit AcrA (membrane-fusion protein)